MITHPLKTPKEASPWSCMGCLRRSWRIDCPLWHWVLSIYTQWKLDQPFSLCI